MKHNSVAGKPGLDPTLPNVSLILGGVKRSLAFDFNAIVLAEKVTGVNLLKAIVNEITATNLRGLLWAALLKENPELNLEEVGSWITMRNAGTIHEALVMAWFGSVAEVDGEGETEGEETAQTISV
jgi:hypothetical protein